MRNRCQTAVWNAACYTLAPLAHYVTRMRRPRVHACLVYHGVVEESDENVPYDKSVHISTETLRTHLSILCRLGARPVTVDEVARSIRAGRSLPGFSVSITFDDAYANIVKNALPVLEQHGFKATVFAPAGYVDTEELLWNDLIHYLVDSEIECRELGIPELGDRGLMTAQEVVYALKTVANHVRLDAIRRLEDRADLSRPPDPAGSRICTSEELRMLRSRGWVIGSHSLTHPIMSKMPSSEAFKELIDSRERLADLLGEPPMGFAYPDGDFDDELVALVKRAGYSYAVTAGGAVCTSADDVFMIPRLYPSATGARFTCQVTGWEQAIRGLLHI